MCGIAGIFRPVGPTTEDDTRQVAEMVGLQAHRGPDDEGIRRCAGAVLGHRRLAIIDLSKAGHQPMARSNGKCSITFGGEIYNHVELRRELERTGRVFTSACDTEVILAGYEHWGIETLLQRLRGMFAFAIHDVTDGGNGTIVLARDRIGIKPLYYATRPDHSLCFASEVRALVRSSTVGSESDPRAIIGLLMYGSVPAPMTSVKNVECLEPGSYLIVANSGLTKRRYWDLRPSEGRETGGASVAELLRESIRLHLVSDVPVGVFLSGGLDSAALLALVQEVSDVQPHSLTVTLPNSRLSEDIQARKTAGWFGAAHTEVALKDEDFAEALPDLLASIDQPTCDGVNTYFISRAARRAGIKVVLSGLGADEVFWGYKHYQLFSSPGARLLASLPPAAARMAARAMVSYGAVRGDQRWKKAQYLGRRPWEDGLYLLVRGLFSATETAALAGVSQAELKSVLDDTFDVIPARSKRFAGGRRFNYLEFHRYLHDQLLRDGDVFSMAHSIELRVPFLDDQLVQAAQLCNLSETLARDVNKPVLVNALGDSRLASLAARPKRGFTLPMDSWIRNHAGDLESLTLSSPLFDRTAVHACWRAFKFGHSHWSRPWLLAVAAASRAAYTHSVN